LPAPEARDRREIVKGLIKTKEEKKELKNVTEELHLAVAGIRTLE